MNPEIQILYAEKALRRAGVVDFVDVVDGIELVLAERDRANRECSRLREEAAAHDAVDTADANAELGTYVVIEGDPIDGFTLWGPFYNLDDAEATADEAIMGDCWWLMLLRPVADLRRRAGR